jgi:hypothetical protein
MDGEERIQFEAHLDDCTACVSAVRAQRRLDELSARLPTYRAPVTLGAGRSRRTVGRRIGTALVAAAAIALLLFRTDEASLPPLVAEALAADVVAIESATSASRTGVLPSPDERTTAPAIPWLGFVTCSEQIAPRVDGVYICALRRDAPLARAGVSAGDVLVAVGGRRVASDTAMYKELVRYSTGEEITVAVRRGEELRRLRVALIERRFGARHPFDLEWSPALLASLDRPRVPDEDFEQIFVPLSDSAAARLNVPAGLLIGRTPPKESTERTILIALPYFFGPHGLRVGDVITAVQGCDIRTRGELMMRLMDVQHVPFTLTVHRAGEVLELGFRKEPPPAQSNETASRP